MSKFLDRLEQIHQGAPAPMGFGAARRQRIPALALVAIVSRDHASGVNALAALEPDATLLSGVADAAALKEQAGKLSCSWGARVDGLTEEQAQSYQSCGSDLLAFGLENTPVAAVTEDSLARLLCVKPGMEESQVRALDGLPVDVLLVDFTSHKGYWTLADLAQVGAISRRVNKFVTLELSDIPSKKELEALRNIGAHGVALDVSAVSPDALKELKTTLLDLPRPKPRRSRVSATLPRSAFAALSEREAPEEPDHDHEHDDDDE